MLCQDLYRAKPATQWILIVSTLHSARKPFFATIYRAVRAFFARENSFARLPLNTAAVAPLINVVHCCGRE